MKYVLSIALVIATSSHPIFPCPDPSRGDCGRCTSVNDPHITTFDGVFYDQHTEDCFQYVVQCRKAPSTAPVPFEICGCHYNCGSSSSGPACIGDVTISFFDSSGETYNIEIDYTSALDAYDTTHGIHLSPGIYTFDAAALHQFRYNHAGNQHTFAIVGGTGTPSFYGYVSYQPGYLEVFLDETYFQQRNVCGLCGRFDWFPGNDFIGSDGIQYLNPALITWPIPPPVVNQINNFANTYLCDDEDDDPTHCYEIAKVCCESKWKEVLSTRKWRNPIVSPDKIKENWLLGCVVDACALTNNQLTKECADGLQFAKENAENTALRTYK